MTEAVFAVEGTTAHPTRRAAGPWNAGLMHGGAPSALVVRAAEQVATAEPMHVARVTVELLRPVPIAPLAIETEVVRQGRKIQLVQVRLLAEGVEVTRGLVLKVRRAPLGLPQDVGLPPLDVPPPEAVPPMEGHLRDDLSFATGFDIRSVAGGIRLAGPGVCWFNRPSPIVAGEPTSPAMLAAAVADFTNGVSSVLDFDRYTFVNADLTVSFARAPVGDWILSHAESWIGPDGAGLAATRLADRHGYFGRAVETLVVEPR